jgi:hypothetical protein
LNLAPGDLVQISKLVAIKYFAGKLGVVMDHIMTYEADDIDTAAQSGNYFKVTLADTVKESHIFHEENLSLISKGRKE